MHQPTRNIHKQTENILQNVEEMLAWNRPTPAILNRIELLTNPLFSKISNRFKRLFSFSYLAHEARNFVWNATTVSSTAHRPFIFNTMTFDLSSHPSKALQLKSLLERLCSIPAMKALIQHAFRGDNFQVVFADRTALFSEGECHYHRKSIRIAREQSTYDILSTLLFELCNAANNRLSEILIKDYQNADDYALAMERAEFITYQQHLRLLQLLANNQEFTRLLSQMGENPRKLNLEINNAYKSFAEYWEGANRLHHKAYSHSEYYRRHYQQMNALNQYFYQASSSSPALHPQFDYSRQTQPHSTLAKAFSSHTARELLETIKHNPNALSVFNRFQKPLATCLAKNVTAHSLQRFKTLNGASQTYFLQEYAKRYNPLLTNVATTPTTTINQYTPSV